MSQYDQQQAPVAYPPSAAPPLSATVPPEPVVAEYEGNNYNQGPYVAAPPPAGYPTTTSGHNDSVFVPAQTSSKGEGFWKGCVAALCCCWVLDFCCC